MADRDVSNIERMRAYKSYMSNPTSILDPTHYKIFCTDTVKEIAQARGVRNLIGDKEQIWARMIKDTPRAPVAKQVVKRASPVAKKASPAAKRASPDTKRASPAAKRVSPAAKKASPAVKRASPAAKRASPVAKKASPAAKRASPIQEDLDEESYDEEVSVDDDEEETEEEEEEEEEEEVYSDEDVNDGPEFHESISEAEFKAMRSKFDQVIIANANKAAVESIRLYYTYQFKEIKRQPAALKSKDALQEFINEFNVEKFHRLKKNHPEVYQRYVDLVETSARDKKLHDLPDDLVEAMRPSFLIDRPTDDFVDASGVSKNRSTKH